MSIKLLAFFLPVLAILQPLSALSQPMVDIGLFESSSDTLEVRLRPDSAFDEVVSNVAFTIRWDTASGAHLGRVIQSMPEIAYIPMSKSGGERDSLGNRYQVFAGFGSQQMNNFGASWLPGQEVVLMKVVVQGTCDSFEIVNDFWTGDIQNNGDYFISLNGQNQTDSIYHPTVPLFNTGFASTGPGDTICQGSSATLTASGGQSYSWSNGQTGSSITVAPASTTHYTVSVTDTSGCQESDTVTVYVQPPSIDTVMATICQGDTLTMHGNHYTSSGSFIDTLQDGAGCDSIVATNLSVHSPPSPQISYDGDTVSNPTICDGDTATLHVNGGNTFQWSTGATRPSIDVSPSSTTTFSVTATDTNSCTNQDTIVITVDTVPTPTITKYRSTYCFKGDRDTLAGEPGGGTFMGPGMTGNLFDPASAGVGNHQIIYRVSSNGHCEAFDTIETEVTVCSGISETDERFRVSVYPNPTKEHLYVQTSGHRPSELKLVLFGATGKKIEQWNCSIDALVPNCSVSLPPSIPSGLYYLRIQGAHSRFSIHKKVIKL